MKERLGPGAWRDEEGAVHFDLVEILRYAGLPDCPENREILAKVICDFAADTHPGAEVIHVTTQNVANN